MSPGKLRSSAVRPERSSHAGRSNMTKTGLGLPRIGILLVNRTFICLPCHPCCLDFYVIRYLSRNGESHGAREGILIILPVLFRQESGHRVREEHFSRSQRLVGPDGWAGTSPMSDEGKIPTQKRWAAGIHPSYKTARVGGG